MTHAAIVAGSSPGSVSTCATCVKSTATINLSVSDFLSADRTREGPDATRQAKPSYTVVSSGAGSCPASAGCSAAAAAVLRLAAIGSISTQAAIAPQNVTA